jgi:hypothetical protein
MEGGLLWCNLNKIKEFERSYPQSDDVNYLQRRCGGREGGKEILQSCTGGHDSSLLPEGHPLQH